MCSSDLEDDEVKSMMRSPEVKEALYNLDDKDLSLLLNYVDDQPMADVEREKAAEKLEELRALVYDRRSSF